MHSLPPILSVSVSYNPKTGVSFESQLTPSSMESEEDTPLLDEDENCDEETKSTKVTQSPPQYVRTRTKHFHYSVKRCMNDSAKNRETGSMYAAGRYHA